MTPQAGGALARAVGLAGGLGMLGFDEDESEESISQQLAILKAEPAVPFGIGLVAWVLEKRPSLLDLAIAAEPKLISISEAILIAIGRAEHEIQKIAGTQMLTVNLHISGDAPPAALDRTLEA